jgi:hypothetical protein
VASGCAIVTKMVSRSSRMKWFREWFIGHASWHFTGDPLLGWVQAHLWRTVGYAILSGAVSISLNYIHHLPIPIWVASSLALFGLALVISGGRTVKGKSSVVSESALIRPSEKRGELRFDYPGEPLGHRWVSSIAGGQRPTFALSANAPVPGSVDIKGTWDPGIDCPVEPYPGLSNRLRYTAKFPSHAAVYAHLTVTNADGSPRIPVWIQHVIGNGDESPEGEGNERKVYLAGTPVGHGWLFFDVSLADELRSAYKQESLTLRGILEIRMRGSLSISPIEFYSGQRP